MVMWYDIKELFWLILNYLAKEEKTLDREKTERIMKMKKKFFAAALAVMMFAAAGCGKKTEVTLGEYKGIALTRVSNTAVETEIETILKNNATLETVERAAALGDTVNINYAGTMDGVAFEGGTDDTEAGTDLVLGSSRFIDGFEDGLVGATAGQVIELNLQFPDPYTVNPDFAGLPVNFKVTVNAVKESVVPELTDEYIAANSDYATVDEFRAALVDNMNEEAFNSQISTSLLASSTVENISEDEVANQKAAFVSQYTNMANYYATMYSIDVATALQVFFGVESEEQLAEYGEEYARRMVTYTAIVEKIADVEKIKVTDEQYNESAALYAQEYGFDNAEALITQYGEETVREQALMDLVIDFCIENAVITDAAE